MPILTISKAPGANPADGPSWADRIRGAFRSSSGRNEGDIFTGPAESHGGLRDAAYATGERPKSDRALLSSDGKTENMEREELMKESRRLFENVAAVKVAEKAHSRFCSPVMWYAGTGDDEDDLVLTRYIARQMEADRFDIARAHDLPTSVASAIIDWGVDGDIFANMVTPRNSDRFRVQWVRAHRVGKSDKTIDVSEEITAAFRQRAPQRFREIGGIVVDSLDERRAIRVYPANRNMMAGVTEKPKTIPWSQVLHLVDPLKTDRLREVTRWNSAIPEIVDLEQTWRFLKATIKQQVAAPIVETSKDGRPKPSQRRPSLDSSSSEPSDEKPPLREMVPGQFQYLRDGEKIADFTMQRPNATFFECVEYLLRNGSWAIDMPYPFIYEPKGMNGGTLRLENSKAGASVGYSRGKVTKCLLDPWVRAKILEGIRLGELNYSLADLPKLAKGRWAWPELPTADEKYRDSMTISLYESGLCSGQDVVGPKGTTIEAVQDQKAKEAERRVKLATKCQERYPQTSLDWWLDQISKIGPNGAVPYRFPSDVEEENNKKRPAGTSSQESLMIDGRLATVEATMTQIAAESRKTRTQQEEITEQLELAL